MSVLFPQPVQEMGQPLANGVLSLCWCMEGSRALGIAICNVFY